MRPIYIGIIGKHIANSKITYATSSMVRDEVIHTLTYFGATPIGIPLPTSYPDQEKDVFLHLQASFPEKELAIVNNYLDLCDGIIFQGGSHIDHYEYELARLVHQRNIPALGFCSGQTAMVAALASVEIVDVDQKIHRLPEINNAHGATTVQGTRFSEIIQTDSFWVNSRHRTCIASISKSTNSKTSASPLRISALGPEGYAEVIEGTSNKFYLSTRFHPESNFRDKFMSRIFEAFIAETH